MKKFAPLMLALMLATSCADSVLPEGVMDEPTMTKFLAEVYLLEGYYANECGYEFESKSPEITKAYDHLLAKYGLSKGDFEKSLAYYLDDEERFARVHENALNALNEQAQ